MSTYHVAIIGGGLAGLYAAQALHASGIDTVVIEARDRLGGRILSADETGHPSEDGFDLGPSWFWPTMQPAMAELVDELSLQSFAQNSVGDVVFERMSRERPQRFSPAMENQQSMRIAGGTAAAIRALAGKLPADRIFLRTKVIAMTLMDKGVELNVEAGDTGIRTLTAARVIAALPPRLLETSVTFSPAQDEATVARWRGTPTWMAPHAKFFAVYDRPFWRADGLAGTAQSMVGPMVEIHDATTASGKPALFGFLGISAAQRATLGDASLKQACIAQLGRLFGSEALSPRATLLKDWAADPFTATTADSVGGDHPMPGSPKWVFGPWEKHLLLAGSETSDTEPGYLAGAVEAAKRAVARILSDVETP
ncbi:NAD(P)-binding protein [Rhizobium sp. P38BS-XIX]|uniref:flavin monoamine oxidase family protein n=1 Tax=Rhizobium sp. P38BS-XIX TaxID=2726740 RepID=UPI00145766FB|nr:FAD-dependent oxidoreductase [Rhizobium sp. P38BS-XIX]NLS00434.1 NAD(P)-binding protein [Rhizobium sp. P38BS-XIX]